MRSGKGGETNNRSPKTSVCEPQRPRRLICSRSLAIVVCPPCICCVPCCASVLKTYPQYCGMASEEPPCPRPSPGAERSANLAPKSSLGSPKNQKQHTTALRDRPDLWRQPCRCLCDSWGARVRRRGSWGFGLESTNEGAVSCRNASQLIFTLVLGEPRDRSATASERADQTGAERPHRVRGPGATPLTRDVGRQNSSEQIVT